MDKFQAKDLFQLQTELIDMKVDMAVSKSVDRLFNQMTELRHEVPREIHGLRNEMHDLKGEVKERLIAVETKLGMVNANQTLFRNKFVEYTFKALWAVLGATSLYIGHQLYIFFK